MAKRYDGGGKVSESEDTATANARADARSVDQAYEYYGKNNTWIRNRAGTINPEPKVSPLIYVYPEPKRKSYAKGGLVHDPASGGKVLNSKSYSKQGR